MFRRCAKLPPQIAAQCKKGWEFGFLRSRGSQDLRLMRRRDLAGLPLKLIERRRFGQRLSLLQVALAIACFPSKATRFGGRIPAPAILPRAPLPLGKGGKAGLREARGSQGPARQPSPRLGALPTEGQCKPEGCIGTLVPTSAGERAATLRPGPFLSESSGPAGMVGRTGRAGPGLRAVRSPNRFTFGRPRPCVRTRNGHALARGACLPRPCHVSGASRPQHVPGTSLPVAHPQNLQRRDGKPVLRKQGAGAAHSRIARNANRERHAFASRTARAHRRRKRRRRRRRRRQGRRRRKRRRQRRWQLQRWTRSCIRYRTDPDLMV